MLRGTKFSVALCGIDSYHMLVKISTALNRERPSVLLAHYDTFHDRHRPNYLHIYSQIAP